MKFHQGNALAFGTLTLEPSILYRGAQETLCIKVNLSQDDLGYGVCRDDLKAQ